MHVTVCPEVAQFHPLPTAEAKVKPGGSISVTVAVPVAAVAPMFVIINV
jgi:hypothetical protein